MPSDDLARDTIAALATPAGRGGIGIVRISGPAVPRIAVEIIGRLPTARRATLARFTDARGQMIDEGIAVYFPAPRSYTGEDVLELHGHGGPVVMQMLLAACLDSGARLAEPGEFTRRALLECRLDLAQAEAVADLIDAASREAARCALRSLSGEFSAAIEALGMARTQQELGRADVVLAVYEAGSDSPPLRNLPEVARIEVYNKVDLRPGFEAPQGAIAVSARTGEGLAELRRAILSAAGCSATGVSVFLDR